MNFVGQYRSPKDISFAKAGNKKMLSFPIEKIEIITYNCGTNIRRESCHHIAQFK
jgi:hypothetical protein